MPHPAPHTPPRSPDLTDRPRAESTPSRRALLRGQLSTRPHPRPLGALRPMAFEELCTQCGACAFACPEGIVMRDGEGFPVLDMSAGSCTFCGACTEACEAGALVAGAAFPWRAEVSEACLSLGGTPCRACEDRCDTDAIRFRPLLGGRSQPIFAADACTGCGACIAPCPAGAIALVPLSSPHTPPTEPASC